MANQTPRQAADLREVLARIQEAADLTGVKPGTVTNLLFKDYRLPERIERQIEATEARTASLEEYLARLRNQNQSSE
ncbi:hypothetical protein SAMN05421774_10881 [Gemmobacter megaterium]|uniref:Uncharacterized protein n=1 Tax=Gemmobacter megaterium TaxID=1086013 RepID=A0A1N7QBG0_9RHOB|nr:hypothetical protein [Gemmobacter megaterium]GGE24110.1 hypothetical protein GCM10011345_32630 [Gemmobacter megaterium]SIT20144.1 hypothetical protein SAMN05421774_10881 [Gemmobacter megaterium]